MSVVTVPSKVYIAASASEGSTPINAFDNCLVKAGIPQISLIKVTSILPHKIEIVENPPEYPDGANVPAIYTYIVSDKPGETITAAIGVAFTNGVTLVAEHSAKANSEEVIEHVKEMLKEMAKSRDLKIEKIIVKHATHKVEKLGCALAVVTEL